MNSSWLSSSSKCWNDVVDVARRWLGAVEGRPIMVDWLRRSLGAEEDGRIIVLVWWW